LSFRPVRICEIRDESSVHRTVAFEPARGEDVEILALRAPGQYVRFATEGGGQSLYALANAPGEAWEILVKREGSSLSTAQVGDERLVTPPQGRGFPVREHAGRDLVLVGVGTGIAPLRGVLRVVTAARADFGRVTLVYGQRTRAEMAYPADRARWASLGVEIVLVSSREDDPPRHVQDVLAAGMPGLRGGIAYVCGMPAMVDEVTRVLHAAGVAEEHVFQNY
jgi:NAD(P)H-flavin reductase